MNKYSEMLEREVREIKKQTVPLAELKTQLKEKIKSKERAYADAEKVYAKARDDNEKAHQEEKKAQTALATARSKVQKAKTESDAAGADKSENRDSNRD